MPANQDSTPKEHKMSETNSLNGKLPKKYSSIKTIEDQTRQIKQAAAEIELEQGMVDLIHSVQYKYGLELNTIRYSMLNAIYDVEKTRKEAVGGRI